MIRSLAHRLARLEALRSEDRRAHTLEQLVAGSYGKPVGEPAGERDPGRPSLVELILAAARARP